MRVVGEWGMTQRQREMNVKGVKKCAARIGVPSGVSDTLRRRTAGRPFPRRVRHTGLRSQSHGVRKLCVMPKRCNRA